MKLTEDDLRIHRGVYEWTIRTISLLEKVLRVNIKLHERQGQLADGDIFLFNHFARFETFIPQYLIYRETGAFSRSVASPEFFHEGDTLSRYLLSLGAVPTDYEGLLPFLAAEVLRGRKVVVFPEGGMVKDRRVLDGRGQYSVYSRISRDRRKHHTGAALLALALDGFKSAVLEAAESGDEEKLARWAANLRLDGPEALLGAARKPTSVVPANITFYPIRLTHNLLERGAELFSRGLTPRAAEELLIEGNILLTHTDMDIRLGEPVIPTAFWSWWERGLLRGVSRRIEALPDLFELRSRQAPWRRRLLGRRLSTNTLRMRDAYMRGMYEGVTVNLSHLASRLIFQLLGRGMDEVGVERFHGALYLALKRLQGEPSIHLHRSLQNPEAYGGLLKDRCEGLQQFVEVASKSKLVERTAGTYRFLPKLRTEFGFDQVRLENLVVVYANEVEPVGEVTRRVEQAFNEAPAVDSRRLARMQFDDEVRGYRWDWRAFHKPRHEEINSQESATLTGEPFLLEPESGRRDVGILLVHGFTASPAEVRPFGDRLLELGYPTLGIRLKGHGTSPWDLLERRWEDWFDSVRRGYEILSALASRVCLVGFSGGGDLALRLAAEAPPGLAGAVAVAAPIKLREKAMSLVPLVHGANVLVESVSSARGIMLFHTADVEHPGINYRRMPIRALYELGQLIHETEGHLGEVRCPVLLLQGTGDPTVDAHSVGTLYKGLGSEDKALVMIPSDRHGILFEDTGGTQGKILEFLERLERAPASDPAWGLATP